MNIVLYMNIKCSNCLENFFKTFGTFKMQFLDVLYSIHLLLKVLHIKMQFFTVYIKLTMNNIVKLTFIVQKYIYLYLYTHK